MPGMFERSVGRNWEKNKSCKISILHLASLLNVPAKSLSEGNWGEGFGALLECRQPYFTIFHRPASFPVSF